MPIEMLAIGDSLHSGVRSLAIESDRALHSVPAQVARAFRWSFFSPDYPRPMLADFEKVFCDPPLSGTLNSMKNGQGQCACLADGTWSRQP